MNAINLTGADLAANQQGRLSPQQHRQLIRQRYLLLVGTVGFALLLILLLALLLWKLRTPAFAGRGQLFLLVPLALFWLWLLRHFPRQWLHTGQDLHEGVILSVEGVVQPDFNLGIGLIQTIRYRLQIGNYDFNVGKDTFRQFRPGEWYRVVYTPHSQTFLGAIPLEGAKAELATDRINVGATLLEPLTRREEEVLRLLAAGLSNNEIAAELSLSLNTIKMYTSQIYQKLGVSRRTEAVARARQLNLL